MFWNIKSLDKCNYIVDYEGLRVTDSDKIDLNAAMPIIGGYKLLQSNLKR